jgi:putative tryptophan/tyrosine transport system substrate-binding protein
LCPINALDAAVIERGIAAFARSSKGGVIVTVAGTGYRRDLIIPLMARHRLPAVYPFRYHVADGGLICYGPVPIDLTMSIVSLMLKCQLTCRFRPQPV